MEKPTELPFIPPLASAAAGDIDLLFWVVNGVAAFFSLGIVLAIIILAVKYRRGSKADRSNAPAHNDTIEVVWTVIPLGIALALFLWSTVLFLLQRRFPEGAMEIHVVGKQWMWKLQHPEGRWEMNQLHVPTGRPVVLVMTSEDVIHSFFVPAFRLKMDVIPGTYTRMWFTPTRVGMYPLYCAEFCGTLHSQMAGTVTVMEPTDYARWLREGSQRESVAALGERVFMRKGCNGCHGPASSVRAPRLEGIFGKPFPIQIPKPGVLLEKIEATTVIVDRRYIHDSILLPKQEVAAGYKPIMPTFKNRISEEEIFQIVEYIRSLSQRSPEDAGPGKNSTLTEEDYRTRTGFVPKNIKELTGQQSPKSKVQSPKSEIQSPKSPIGTSNQERMQR